MKKMLAIGCVAAAALTVTASTLTASAREDVQAWPTASTNRIIGGTAATQKYPYTGWLGGCASALISPTWVVTASHCKATNARSVRFDTNTNNSGGEQVQIKRWITHPQYDPQGMHNDVALIELQNPARTAPIKIAPVMPPLGTPTRIIGWGSTQPTGGAPVRDLRELDTSIVNDDRCRANNINPGKDLCTDAPNGNSGACRGDSGGPQIANVFNNWYLVGVTSRGDDVCAKNPSIYTSVTAYLDWLRQTSGVQDLGKDW